MLHNAYWYWSLVAASLIILFSTFWKKKDWRLLILFLSAHSIIIPFEFVVLLLLRGYRYLPGVAENLWNDNLIGAIVSNFFTVPTLAVMVAAFKLNVVWMMTIAFTLMGIERLFVSLGIFEYYWWKTIFTGIGALVFFVVINRLWRSIQANNIHRGIYLLILYLCYFAIHLRIIHLIRMTFHGFEFQLGWFADPMRDHIVATVTYHFVLTAIVIAIYLGTHWICRVIGAIVVYIFDRLLWQWGILYITTTLSLWHLMAIHIVVAVLVLLLINQKPWIINQES